METALEGGRIVEQLVAASHMTNVAGFWLNSPGLCRLESKQILLSTCHSWKRLDVALSTCLDESFITPASLYIRVVSLQVQY